MKRFISIIAAAAIMLLATPVYAENEADNKVKLDTEAKSCILMEESSGQVLYEENADEQLPIASVTKIMTMLLIMEQIESGALSYDTMIPVSENAMSYGGSTMFLEAGEQLSVNDMLKGIAVASANDGCVAMAEYIAGSETAFVDMMNKKAQELGMTNTHFMNTNGLDEENHYSSARDVAIMSKALIAHKDIFNYTSIWTDELRGGKFQLANTNKLIRFYTGANGLKTGSTSQALCCLSATAVRDNMQLIAVVLGSPTSAKRFSSAKALLDYGFANYGVKVLTQEGEEIIDAAVEKGNAETVKGISGTSLSELRKKSDTGDCERIIELDENIKAPVYKGDRIGTMKFVRGDTEVGSVDIISADTVERMGIGGIMEEFLRMIFARGSKV